MGRVGNNEQQVQETMDDSFPESEQPAATKPRSQVPSNNKRQTNHPHKEEEEEDLYYVSSQDHDKEQTAAQFPPQNNEYDLSNQHVPPQANVDFAPHMPPSGTQNGVPQTGHPAMTPPVRPFDGIGHVAAQDKVWSSSLFDCMNDPENALITACFPCITFGQIAEILDSGNTTCATSGILYSCIAFCIAMPCIMSCTYRTKLRAKFGLLESPAQDWVVHCFCEWCALCQEYRELKHMGYDPTIGWLGNEAKMRQKQNQQFGMTPPTGQMMMMM
ncbi:protein PLANT CADMIUM RESISTANCE 6-like [Primulina eburnea]|uniref:protein PLANT CADMIUM RESISTANCE 6-like n=1 Tax=Primulina eburnea TaxID=1245227 RepID=UPI003C6C5CE1